jgi:hypothetical protein
LAVMAHKCQGRAGWCQAVFTALTPPAIVTWCFDWRPVGHVPKCQISWHHLSPVPPTPPPRGLGALV